MSKREAGFLSGNVDMEGSRAKRRKESATTGQQNTDVSDPVVGESSQVEAGSNEGVKEQGLKLWHIVKDAVNKEGRSISLDFLRQPSKRQYPDYYQQIKRPIALDDIKKNLDNGIYKSLSAVKEDFDLCFKNAREYNMKDSDIWKDAKQMQKLVRKEYSKMMGEGEDAQVDVVDDEGGEGGKKKTKPPNMIRLLKTRLTKLVEKGDDTGRVLSTEFMELPSKKEWPYYYKEIKRPQCLENIFKHLKRKEYHTSAEFANDVELVFSNAMSFNQEHTPIWEDARRLRDYFRQLMSDLPPPFALPQYAKPSNGKIKLKMPTPAQPSASTSTIPLPQSTATPETASLQVTPQKIAPVAVPQPTPADVLAPAPVAAIPTPPTAVSVPQAPHQAQSSATNTPATTSQPLPQVSTTYVHHYPNASYQPPVGTSTAVAQPALSSTSVPPATQNQVSHSVSNSPAPVPISPHHQLKCVSVTTDPRRRPLNLDYRDGVKSWALRLGACEKAIFISGVSFLHEEEESSGEEDHEEKEEEEGEDAMDVDPPGKNGKKKNKGKGRGRPPKNAVKPVVKTKTVRKKKAPKLDEIQVKLNGLIMSRKEDHPGEWLIDIPVGSNVLEVGEKGGLIWKVYTERPADP